MGATASAQFWVEANIFVENAATAFILLFFLEGVCWLAGYITYNSSNVCCMLCYVRPSS